jgi:hypothetical protein
MKKCLVLASLIALCMTSVAHSEDSASTPVPAKQEQHKQLSVPDFKGEGTVEGVRPGKGCPCEGGGVSPSCCKR